MHSVVDPSKLNLPKMFAVRASTLSLRCARNRTVRVTTLVSSCLRRTTSNDANRADAKPQPLKEQIYNVPNLLSLARIAATPFLGYAIVQGHLPLAAGLFAAAAMSDVADGIIARRYNMQTVVGSFLDPMSDKFLAITVTAALGAQSLLSPAVAILLVAKDVALLLGTIVVRVVSVRTWRLSTLINVRDVPVSSVAPTLLG